MTKVPENGMANPRRLCVCPAMLDGLSDSPIPIGKAVAIEWTLLKRTGCARSKTCPVPDRKLSGTDPFGANRIESARRYTGERWLILLNSAVILASKSGPRTSEHEG